MATACDASPRVIIWFSGHYRDILSSQEERHFQTIITDIIGNFYIKKSEWSFEYQDGDDQGEFEVRLKKFVDIETANKMVDVIKSNVSSQARFIPDKYKSWLRSARVYTLPSRRRSIRLVGQ